MLGIRSKEKILVVHQSSSAGINSQSKLLNSIVEAVKRTLRSNGYSYVGAAGILDKVLSILKDPQSTFNFRAAFKKYHEKFMEYSSPEEVISDLENLDETERIELLENIADVAEKESYNWSMSVQDVIEWLQDVRIKNNLYAIFFIWDEFTEYFRNNLNNITGLQELAQTSSELNFYFFLITHSDANQLITDSVQRKIIESRFKTATITLAEGTAFQLMAQSLIIEPELKNEWSQISNELWENVRRKAAKFLAEHDRSVKLDDVKKLLPIHPYAAYLLKSIAQSISSNQRTMFQFLCADNETAFPNFIANHEFKAEGDNFLTTDFLWDYFFQEDNPDLDKTFQEAMSYYNNFAGFCKNEIHHRILKTTLILFALQQKSIGRRGGASALLRSTLKNICANFSGTPLEQDVNSTMDYFARRGILSPLEESDDVYYIMATAQVDSERMSKITEQVQKEQSFDKIINDENYGPVQKFTPTNFLQYRLNIQMSSPTKFLQSANSEISSATNQIMTFYIFAVDETEQGKVNQTIKKIRSRFPDRCLIADFSATPFTRQRYDKFILNKARERYFKDIPNQTAQVKLAKKSAAELVAEWIRQLTVANVRVWYSAQESVQVSGYENFFRTLGELNGKFFGSGPEEISENDKIFSPTGLTDKVALCALDLSRVKGPFTWLRTFSDEFNKLTTQNEERYWINNPSNPISKMKSIVENIIRNNLMQKKEISLCELWDELKNPPVGLMKSAASIFLLTLLLRDYADKNFYIRDLNNNTGLLTGLELVNLVVITVKELPQAKEKFLIEQTPMQQKFCWISAEIFKIAEEKATSIDDTIKNVRIRLAQNRYPLWLLNYFVEQNLSQDSRKNSCLQFLYLFNEIVRPQNNHQLTKFADEIFLIYDKNHGIVDKIKSVVQKENLHAGVLIYTEQYKPEIKQICMRLDITETDYLSMLTEEFSADAAYLWTIEAVNKQIDNLFNELRLIEVINPLLPANQKNLYDVRQALSERLNRIRIPYNIIEEYYPVLKDILQALVAIHNNIEKNFARAAERIEKSKKIFTDFFDHQLSAFYEALTIYVDGNIDREISDRFFREMPTGTFFQSRDEFLSLIRLKLKKIRQSEKIGKIFDAWHKLTGTASPADWSNKNEIPILCLFMDCLDEAQLYFPVLNKHLQLPNETKLDDALKFISSEKISRLKNKTFCEKNFISYFCGEDFSQVIDVTSLRGLLRRHAGNDVYSWFTKKKIYDAQIKTFTTSIYLQNLLPSVQKKIRSLTAKQAQNYLEDLVDKDPLFGIRILKDSQGERK